MTLRPMQAADADAVLALQRLAYPPSHHESWAVLGRKLALWPAGCWVLAGDKGLLGYLFSHPGRQQAPPLLHAELTLPAQADAYALHDLALRPEARGRGLARSLFAQAEREAGRAGLAVMSLVAVQGSAPFWMRQGFAPLSQLPQALAHKLASFGPDACFMQRALA